jgi:hypothetical protein
VVEASLVKKRRLATVVLPGTVAAAAGFGATVAKPKAWETILRIIRDEQDDDAIKAADARTGYEAAIDNMIKRLHWKDFELLIDLVFARTGWTRISILGATLKDIDMEVQNPTADEIAFVQVKSSADQPVLDHYIEQFNAQSDRYAPDNAADHLDRGLQGRAGRCCIDCGDVAGQLNLIEERAARPVFPRVAVVFDPTIGHQLPSRMDTKPAYPAMAKIC